MAGRFEAWLRKTFKHKEIGWTQIGETFTRWAIIKTRWFSLYLHKLDAPNWHPECHDHPWGFVALLLKSGYLERTAKGTFKRRPGSVLYRPATFAHNVVTPYGVSWSVILAGPKARDWGFMPCKRLVSDGD